MGVSIVSKRRKRTKSDEDEEADVLEGLGRGVEAASGMGKIQI
jgi:hypothetical protein